MAIATRPTRTEPSALTEKDISTLRSTLDWLRATGNLLETDVEVNPDLEITGIQKTLDGSVPILFNNVKGYPYGRVVTNLFARKSLINQMFGWADHRERTRKLAHALTHPLPPIEISQQDAPVQEDVITDDLEINKWVVAIRHTALESEMTIGSGNSVVVGPYFHGGSHIGYNRMAARWGNIATFQSAPGAHMWQIITEHYDDDKPIPLTMCFGVPPAATLIAGGGYDYVVLPRGGDDEHDHRELGVVCIRRRRQARQEDRQWHYHNRVRRFIVRVERHHGCDEHVLLRERQADRARLQGLRARAA